MAAEPVNFRWEAEWKFESRDGSRLKGWSGSSLFSATFHKLMVDAARAFGGEESPEFEDLLYALFDCYKLRGTAAHVGPTTVINPAKWVYVKVTYNASAGESE